MRPPDRNDPFLTTHGTPRKRPMYAQLPSDWELTRLLREHRSFTAVARAVGCSPQAVSYRLRRLGIDSPRQRGGPRSCDFCNIASEDAKIIRFTLSRKTERAGHKTAHYSGSVCLCEPCWRRFAARPRLSRGPRPMAQP